MISQSLPTRAEWCSWCSVVGSPALVTKRDPINTQERGNVSSIPKPRTGLLQSLLSHRRGTLTGRPTSPGSPGSPDSPGSPCTGKKKMEILNILRFSAGTAKPRHECCSKLCFTFSPTAPGFPIPPGGPCGPSAPGGPDGPLGPGGPGGP